MIGYSDYDDDADAELDELRREDAFKRRQQFAMMRHPDPRDPDYAGPDYDE